jgi:long-chain acyl-CoA synthetase
LGYTVAQAYGLTETSAAATITPLDGGDRSAVGRPIRGVTVRIERPNAEGVGEVWIRGPIVMTGYYRDPERTREAMSGEWFRSGDLGRILPDGSLAASPILTVFIVCILSLFVPRHIYPLAL